MGVNLNRFQRVFLSAYNSGNRSADALAQAFWEVFSRQGQRIIIKGKRLETAEENLAHLKSIAEIFLSKELPIFKALQL